MPIYSRRAIAEHFRALLAHHPRQHAIQMTASHFGHAAETVEEVVKSAATTSYLHAVDTRRMPPSMALAAAALAHGLDAATLQAAVDEHCESVGA